MDEADGMDDMAHLTRMTEREEAAKVNYQQLKAGDKLFASRSFASEPAGLPHSVRTLTLLQPTSLPALRHNRSAAPMKPMCDALMVCNRLDKSGGIYGCARHGARSEKRSVCRHASL